VLEIHEPFGSAGLDLVFRNIHASLVLGDGRLLKVVLNGLPDIAFDSLMKAVCQGYKFRLHASVGTFPSFVDSLPEYVAAYRQT
jgi:hypothetical protein